MNQRILSRIASITLSTLAIGCFAAAKGQDSSPTTKILSRTINSQHTKWIEKMMRETRSISVGTKRAQLERVFAPDSSFPSATPMSRRYVYRECPHIKIDVKLRSGKASTTGARLESGNDVIIETTRPFLDAINGRELSSQHRTRRIPVNRQYMKLIGSGLREIQTVKVGMTRGQYAKVFTWDGGLNNSQSPRSVSLKYPFIKAEVTFKLVNTSKKYPDSLSQKDVITHISKPYLEWEYTGA